MTRSDAEVVRFGLVEIFEACRSRGAEDPESGVRVTEKQARILRLLDDQDPTMVGELADFTGVTASTMSLNLKRLEEAGCIRRGRDPDDRRVMNVRLTETGRRIRDGSSVLDRGRVHALLDTLRPEERVRAVDGLRLLLDGAERSRARSDEYLLALTRGGDAGQRGA